MLSREDAFDEFREPRARLIGAEIAPGDVTWRVGAADLFGGKPPPHGAATFSVPAAYVRLAEAVRLPSRSASASRCSTSCSGASRMASASCSSIASDRWCIVCSAMEKSVRRDLHKMTAFLRFRQIADDGGERFVAWFEPEHLILRRVADFFVGRFAAMRWSILTPQGTMHWDGRTRHSRAAFPAMTRPPAMRSKTGGAPTTARPSIRRAPTSTAMQAEMPKKYWRNMPEADLIPGLLAEAEGRARAMVEAAADRAARRERHLHAQARPEKERTIAA